MTDSSYEHTEANRSKRILQMLYRNSRKISVTLNPTVILEMLIVVDRIADLDCCCPTHSFPMDGWADRGCPDGDCDGCPDCLSGQARRIITRLGGA